MVKKATEKLMNQITNFEKLECEKSSNINEVNVKEAKTWVVKIGD